MRKESLAETTRVRTVNGLGNHIELELEVEKGRTTTKIMAGEWDKAGSEGLMVSQTELTRFDDSDAEQGYIVKTVAVKQSRRDA